MNTENTEKDNTVPLYSGKNGFSEPYNIVLFLGHGFADEAKKKELFSFIEKTYGFLQNGGGMSVLTYPDDVRVAGKIRMSSLSAKLSALNEQRTISALITVGAPQGMHTVLADLEDEGRRFPVFSLFPQDDVLGTEAGSDLVIDYRSYALSNSGESHLAAAEETDFEYTGHISDVLIPLIRAALDWDNIKEDSVFIPDLRMQFFKHTGCNLVIYTDSVTGLRAKNHYVLEGVPRKKE